jgi:5-(carboxyamino)imidazole ribonucleotide mutase
MGSDSDFKTMRHAAAVLKGLGVPFDMQVRSAHRTPDDLFEYAGEAERKGLALIIAGAGGAAHLPGMTASKTLVPVIGVPMVATPLGGVDALWSIMQMPAKIGVATVGIGPIGADRAACLAASILALDNDSLRARLAADRPGIPTARAGKVPHRNRKVLVLAESETQHDVLRHASALLEELRVPHAFRVVGEALTDLELSRGVSQDEEEGAAAFIAGSEQGPCLARRVARTTLLPVLAVPLVTGPVASLDQFVQPFREMPPGVATFAIGRPGAINAALFAATFLSSPGSPLRNRLKKIRQELVLRARARRA